MKWLAFVCESSLFDTLLKAGNVKSAIRLRGRFRPGSPRNRAGPLGAEEGLMYVAVVGLWIYSQGPERSMAAY